MMRLRRKNNKGSPPIYADLLVETPDGVTRFDVDKDGWLYVAKPLYKKALRIGLVLKNEQRARVWMRVEGAKPAYFSRVVGRMSMMGDEHKQVRVAAIEVKRDGVDYTAWLHEDGTVEVANQPTVR